MDDPLPQHNSTAIVEIVQQEAEVVPPPKKKTRNLKYIVDGHIDKKTRREGQALYDTINKKGNNIVSSCKEFYDMTGVPIAVKIKARTDRGRERSFTTPNFEQYEPKKTLKENEATGDGDESADTTVPYDMDTTMERMVTPTKKAGGAKETKRKQTDLSKICRKCRREYDSALVGSWLGCRARACRFWVHAECVHLHIPGSKKGKKILDMVAEQFYCPDHMPKEDSDSDSDESPPPAPLKKGERLKKVCVETKNKN